MSANVSMMGADWMNVIGKGLTAATAGFNALGSPKGTAPPPPVKPKINWVPIAAIGGATVILVVLAAKKRRRRVAA